MIRVYGECSINYDELNSDALRQDLRAVSSSINANSLKSMKEEKISNALSKYKNLPMKKQKNQDAISKVENLKGYEFDPIKADRVKAAIHNVITKPKGNAVTNNLEDHGFDDTAANRVNAAIQE